MNRTRGIVLAVTLLVSVLAGTAGAMHFSPWGTAQKIDEIAGNHPDLNTAFLDGCPIQSPDGLSLYMASNRPGGLGGLDIWVARRDRKDGPFGAPENLGAPVNSAADDFCPTPVRGNGLFFVSRESLPGSCGLGDIYFARQNPAHGWGEPANLGCAPNGPNTALDEMGPSYFEAEGQSYLYFSSSSGSVPGDIFVSERLADGTFGPASAVSGLNSSGERHPAQRPQRRARGRVLLQLRPPGAKGGQDIYAATRTTSPTLVGAGQPRRRREHRSRRVAPLVLAGTRSRSSSGARPAPRGCPTSTSARGTRPRNHADRTRGAGGFERRRRLPRLDGVRRRDPVIGRDRELDELGHDDLDCGRRPREPAAARRGGGRRKDPSRGGRACHGEARLPAKRSRRAGLVAVCADHGGASRSYLRERARWALQCGTDPLSHLRPLLPELGPAPRSTDRETLFEAIRVAFGAIAAHEATVVFLDDLQWADAATLELLPSLAEAAEEWPLLLLGAYRNESIPRGHPLRRLRTDLRRAGRLVEFEVEPLDAAATAELAGRLLDGGSRPGARAALYDRTQGIPFFVEELAAALKAGGRLRRGNRVSSSRKGRAYRYRRRSATRCASGPRVCRTRDELPSRQPQWSESRSTSSSSQRSSATRGSAKSSTAGCSTKCSPGLQPSGTT